MGSDNFFTSFKIACNGYRVIQSGTVIAYSKKGNIEFKIEEFKLKIRFEENDDEKQSIEHENSPNNEIILVCYNYNNPLGSGLADPIHIANSNGKKIFFRFICGNMSSLPWMHYTFYTEV